MLSRLIGNGYEISATNPSRIVDQTNGAEIDLCLSEGTTRWPSLFGNSIDIGLIPVINLPRLIEMKLSTDRLEDTVDVVKLIKRHQLPRTYSEELAEEVHHKWSEIWTDQREMH